MTSPHSEQPDPFGKTCGSLSGPQTSRDCGRRAIAAPQRLGKNTRTLYKCLHIRIHMSKRMCVLVGRAVGFGRRHGCSTPPCSLRRNVQIAVCCLSAKLRQPLLWHRSTYQASQQHSDNRVPDVSFVFVPFAIDAFRPQAATCVELLTCRKALAAGWWCIVRRDVSADGVCCHFP